jgi:hypothetical protein
MPEPWVPRVALQERLDEVAGTRGITALDQRLGFLDRPESRQTVLRVEAAALGRRPHRYGRVPERGQLFPTFLLLGRHGRGDRRLRDVAHRRSHRPKPLRQRGDRVFLAAREVHPVFCIGRPIVELGPRRVDEMPAPVEQPAQGSPSRIEERMQGLLPELRVLRPR